jgi:hypothetical protein
VSAPLCECLPLLVELIFNEGKPMIHLSLEAFSRLGANKISS